MLQIIRHADWAARIVLHLACPEEGAGASIADIAPRTTHRHGKRRG